MTSRKERIEKITVLSTQLEKLGRGQQTFPGKGWVVKILDFEGRGWPLSDILLFPRPPCFSVSTALISLSSLSPVHRQAAFC